MISIAQPFLVAYIKSNHFWLRGRKANEFGCVREKQTILVAGYLKALVQAGIKKCHKFDNSWHF